MDKQESSSGVYSHNSAVRTLSSGSSASTNGHAIGHGNTLVDLTLVQLSNQLPAEVRNLSWEVQMQLGRILNQLKEPRNNDYRLVASRLGFKAHEIDTFSKSLNPTMEMLKLCNNTLTRELLQVILDIERKDILEDLLKYLSVVSKNHHHLPTQESLDDDEKSSLSQPFEESCRNISMLSKQPSEQEDDQQDLEGEAVFKKFLESEESKTFWRNIPGNQSVKKWKDFWSAALISCPDECTHGGIEKFLCHIFKIDYDNRHDGQVQLDFYFRLLAFFGPFKPGSDGCLMKMYDLIQKSVSKGMDGKKHSWFAGYMNKEETEKWLITESPGTFIVRFSGSKVDQGWFIVAVKTREEVVQIEIEKDTLKNELILAGKRYSTLTAIVDKLRRERLVQECAQLCINACPNLPLNSNFLGYTKATPFKKQKRGVGRGKAR